MAAVNFESVLSEFVAGDLSRPEKSIWLVYAAVIVESVGQPTHISELWKYAQNHTKDEHKQLTIARRIREGLLKTSPLAGFPKVRRTTNAPPLLDG